MHGGESCFVKHRIVPTSRQERDHIIRGAVDDYAFLNLRQRFPFLQHIERHGRGLIGHRGATSEPPRQLISLGLTRELRQVAEAFP